MALAELDDCRRVEHLVRITQRGQSCEHAMLLMSREVGDGVVINDTTIATVAVIGRDFVDLFLRTAKGRPLGSVTLSTADLQHVRDGVSALLVRTELSRARIAFDIPRDVTLHRVEFWDRA